jgi:hypothetical protein
MNLHRKSERIDERRGATWENIRCEGFYARQVTLWRRDLGTFIRWHPGPKNVAQGLKLSFAFKRRMSVKNHKLHASLKRVDKCYTSSLLKKNRGDVSERSRALSLERARVMSIVTELILGKYEKARRYRSLNILRSTLYRRFKPAVKCLRRPK